MKKKYVQTFEDFIGANSKRVQHKDIHGQEIISGNTNDRHKEYDQEDDGSDSLPGSPLNY